MINATGLWIIVYDLNGKFTNVSKYIVFNKN